jgi:phosphoglycerate dehydrogenase-like enzyme
MPRVVFLGRMAPPAELIAPVLAPVGAELVGARPDGPSGVVGACREADAVLVHAQPRFDAPVLEALTRCRVIVRLGAGADNVDLEAASRQGIIVCNVPGGNAPDVADQAMGLIVAVARRIFRTYDMVRSGRWSSGTVRGSEYRGPVHRLDGRTLGIFGLGNVGRRVARRAAGFGMRLIACDPYLGDGGRGEVEIRDGSSSLCVPLVDREELFRRSQVLTLHTPLTAETRRAVGSRELAALPGGAILINTARGELVDHDALVEALRSGHLEGAALDVTDPEPLPAGHPLLSMENVIVTAHTCGNTEESFPDICARAAGYVAEVLRGRMPESALNPQVLPRRGEAR